MTYTKTITASTPGSLDKAVAKFTEQSARQWLVAGVAVSPQLRQPDREGDKVEPWLFVAMLERID